MISKKEILSKLSQVKPILSRDFAVKEIGLFGSFATNSFTDESDIDLLVEFERPLGWKFFTLQLYLENIFNRRVDLVTKNALEEPLKEGILRQVQYAP